ncbi:MAG: glucose-6-phosphate isomerase [Peptococcaceae bacterium]|jgi:glucose-6-phosphate isomerase|nr:glucose-6-phosphate isomerase [Peptococcaceae bacterium]
MSKSPETKEISLQVDVNYMMSEYLGAREGISREEIQAKNQEFQEAVRHLKNKRSEMVWRDLPYNQDQVTEQIISFARQKKDACENFVVLGIGGSALGPMAVQQALNHLYYNELPKEQRGGWPRIYILDNVDPERFTHLLDIVDPAKTLFNVITKSGSTSETMAQFLIVVRLLRDRLGDAYKEHVVATTDAVKGNLIKIAQTENYPLFYVPEGVGGRFSELCPVGLLPAAMAGIDIKELLRGAAYMDQWIESKDEIWENPAYLRAVLHYLAYRKGKNISVMMPYADSLKYFADWYAQLWAESLGKRRTLAGEEIFAGQTPVKALGVTDQHSQVQLYTEGPFDKVINFLSVGQFRNSVVIPAGYEDIPAVSFLGGHTLNELMEVERVATEYALVQASRLNATILLPEVTPFTIGQLIYLFEVETAYAGELLKIDAFDQPGVEEGKNATYALMGRPGYEEARAKLNARPVKEAKYILKN